jgi:plastocyanin
MEPRSAGRYDRRGQAGRPGQSIPEDLLARLTRVFLLAFALALLLTAPAAAEEQTQTYRYGPIEVDGYQVKQSDFTIGIPKPKQDGYITGMSVDIVDADGTKVPIQRLMLHHIVFSNLGAKVGDKRDATCGTFTALDSQTRIPAMAERFYAAGEERAVMKLPPGYGYQSRGDDQWLMTWMIMNHRPTTDKAYVQYTLTFDTEPKTPVRPYWLDVRNCLTDPVYNVPGGGSRGSTHTKTATWTAPEDLRIVAAGGHVHGGGKGLAVTQPDCGNRTVFDSKPLWGNPDHPFYNVYPILHEPGPINMSGVTTSQGYAVQKGEKLKLVSRYDNRFPHTRVMGIMQVYAAAADAPVPKCADVPADVQVYKSDAPGRTETPRFKVPIIGLGSNGRARVITRAPGATSRLDGDSTITAKSFFFSRPNVVVDEGTRLTWRFSGRTLHNVTLANGPRGFASQHLSLGREYSKRFTTPGKYQLFCALHPVDMTETVTVRAKDSRR